MMKLKHLFNNRDLVLMLLSNWKYDKDKLQLLEYYRISSNAVYPFEEGGTRYYLRFSPEDERNRSTLNAELDFIKYLRTNDYSAVDIFPSKDNHEIEYKTTPWGNYYALVFKGVSGQRLDKIELTDSVLYGLGRALGQLHQLSQSYKPSHNKRISWEDQIIWMDDVLKQFPNEIEAKKERQIIYTHLSKLPMNKDNYGLIHYDFELDNVFYDECSKSFSIIDFDDVVYHWYAMDVVQTLNSIHNGIIQQSQEAATKHFLEGYHSVIAQQKELSYLSLFERYAALYGYCKCLRSLKEKWDNEPDWMKNLRHKINQNMHLSKERFGQPMKEETTLYFS